MSCFIFLWAIFSFDEVHWHPHRRTGRRAGAAPPPPPKKKTNKQTNKLGASQTFWAAREIWAKPVFKKESFNTAWQIASAMGLKIKKWLTNSQFELREARAPRQTPFAPASSPCTLTRATTNAADTGIAPPY